MHATSTQRAVEYVQYPVYTYPDSYFENTVWCVGVLMSTATVLPWSGRQPASTCAPVA